MKSYWKTLDLRIQIVFTLLVLSFFYAFWQHFTSDILPIHECRKSDSLTQAIQYMRGATFLEPQTNWISPSGNRNAAAEFPIIYYLLGQIWKITGYKLWIAKLLSLSVLIASITSLHQLLFWYFNSKNKALLFAAIIFSAPVLVYYTDTVMPNVYSFSFFLLAVSACFAYLQNRNRGSYLLFTLFLALAILIKVTALIAVLAFIGALFFHVLFARSWKPYLTDHRFYWLSASTLTALLVTFIWYKYAIWYNAFYGATIFSTTIRPVWEVSLEEQLRIIKLVLTEHIKELYHQMVLVPLVILAFWSLFKKDIPAFLRWLIVISFLGLMASIWGANLANSIGKEFEEMVPTVPKIPTRPVFVRSPSTSVLGRITPSTRLFGASWGRSFCCIVRSAFAEAVLQANITSGQPCSNRNLTASRVN